MTQIPWLDIFDGPVSNASELNFALARARAEDALFYHPSNGNSPVPPSRASTLRTSPPTQADEDENLRRFSMRPPTQPILTDEDAYYAAQLELIRKKYMRVMDKKKPPPHLAVRICKKIFHGAFMAAFNVPRASTTKKLSAEDKKKQKKKKKKFTTRGTTKASKARKVKFAWPKKVRVGDECTVGHVR
ncbi:hypothetical protein N0V85_004696 [Neurospora sp. IMI 360204]|nr:hypothetical protein N0V85_004696 [Neurospora sp. IMI 360204]